MNSKIKIKHAYVGEDLKSTAAYNVHDDTRAARITDHGSFLFFWFRGARPTRPVVKKKKNTKHGADEWQKRTGEKPELRLIHPTDPGSKLSDGGAVEGLN